MHELSSYFCGMNLKKGTGLFLAILILISNIGLAFNLHYCGNKIAAVSIQIRAKQKSCCEKKEQTKASCCKNKTVHFQKKSDNATLKFFSFQPQVVYIFFEPQPLISTLKSNFQNTVVSAYYCNANAPPLFKLYHQYIFYA